MSHRDYPAPTRKGYDSTPNCKCLNPDCGAEYYLPPSLAKKNKYCGKACYDAHQTKYARPEITCENPKCGKVFKPKKMDHGVWPKFCSRKCFNAGKLESKIKTCPTCGKEFLAKPSSHHVEGSDGLRQYCSKKCSGKAMRNGTAFECLHCHEVFVLTPCVLRQRGRDEGFTCSVACRSAYYREELAPGWKGGKYIENNSGNVMVRQAARQDRKYSYVGEHRLNAEKVLGRLLSRKECVIRINRDRQDNQPANLFICASYGEWRMRNDGRLPWPTVSNLETYRKEESK